MSDASYLEVVDAVRNYYQNEPDKWAAFAGYGGETMAERVAIAKSVPGVTCTVSRTGSILGWDIANNFPQEFNPPAVIDSNVPNSYYGNGGGFGTKINANFEVIDETTTPPKSSWVSGARKVSGGAKVFTTAANVLSTVAWAGLGAKLGKAINENFGGEYAWHESDWENWVSGLDPLDQAVFRTLFDINGDNTTAYLPEEMLASMYKMLNDMGAYSAPESSVDPNQNAGKGIETGDIIYTSTTCFQQLRPTAPEYYFTPPIGSSSTINIGDIHYFKRNAQPTFKYTSYEKDGVTHIIAVNSSRDALPEGASIFNSEGTLIASISFTSPTSYTYDNKTVYYIDYGFSASEDISVDKHSNPSINDGASIAWLIQYGEHTDTLPVTGIENDPRATTIIDPNLITGTTPETILPQLKQNYPQLFGDSIYEDVPQEDGSTKRITYIPIPWPNRDNKGDPITGTPSQTDPQVDPNTATDTETKTITDTIIGSPTGSPTDTTTVTPPSTGSGDAPATVQPSGSASSLWAVYNPTQAQVDAFGAWLWSSDLVDQIKKLFNDPMQAIIGIHKVFATPATGAAQNIKCGYIDSGVPSAVVTDQYTTVNCGTVNLREYFGNVFDYSPYTEVSLYLPFIGIVKLDCADVMRSSINVKYHVDVITGACLADVVVTRDSAGGVLYQYSGSAIVTYPISSGSYASALAGVVSIAGGLIGTIASGGALAPAALGAAVGISHLHSDVQKSGSFSGAAGAMGGKTPYLIISRPQTAMPSSYKHLEGQPANHYTKLSDASGYVKVRAVQVKGLDATDTELDLIEQLLKQGVEL